MDKVRDATDGDARDVARSAPPVASAATAPRQRSGRRRLPSSWHNAWPCCVRHLTCDFSTVALTCWASHLPRLISAWKTTASSNGIG
eukprot:1228620-Pleurochrysis_carterae.AAC.2